VNTDPSILLNNEESLWLRPRRKPQYRNGWCWWCVIVY
jgi:hypothetical protein